ncbi:MAG: Diphthamide synthase subunit DPH2-like protein [Candidatus Parvarchaeum acidiphilum ARMAN-4]|jgi:2-(3-amino-3-carboxypropyl)histidine synthase|uniref:Diphthamide synthase subunit DPH2-like protein n=1 Tax=Candidatus Parvarchaeum acidiphilum ARMAN-4 TaxID=662760 RepID=D2EG13_PARA4|nr:MAG: Diphthamide synthase subunit DPH2-like protein [Candidatus Parvarchaeum acidiphilum ARMAN-4]
MKYTIKNEGLKYLTEKYDINFDSIIDNIIEKKYNKVAIQIPDGFKLHALDIADMISSNSQAEVYIWGGSTYGACDVPIGLEKFGIKAIIQFGHARFRADELGKSSG